ncbi:helix-turn-helix domain-containing protein [Burkholderia guangdongensis]|uniref:AraC-like ligand-binding domain-containing protein n=1 Tax=Burkholderia guangdongensis TaxID=1792500 RepID=UPI0015CB7081|nr:helix-turn-helix domain-containing protein [Burkholderia guangdongensis]
MKYTELFISTDSVEPEQRNDFWREVTRPVCDTTLAPLDADATLQGTIRTRPLGELVLGATTFNAQRYQRNRRVIVQGDLDFYLLQMIVAGTLRGNFGDRSVSAGPGDICVVDLAQPYESEADAGARLTVAVPRMHLEKALGNRNLHGLVLRGDRPMTRLVVDYLQSLMTVSGQLSVSESFAAQDAAVRLLAAGLAGEAAAAREATSALGVALRARVLEFIDANISRPELSPELLVRRFRISRAHLYRTLADDGGVAQIIRDKRLNHAYAALTRHPEQARPIAEVARACGFSSTTQFVRAFRSRFGIAPGDVRLADPEAIPDVRTTLDFRSHLAHYDAASNERATPPDADPGPE